MPTGAELGYPNWDAAMAAAAEQSARNQAIAAFENRFLSPDPAMQRYGAAGLPQFPGVQLADMASNPSFPLMAGQIPFGLSPTPQAGTNPLPIAGTNMNALLQQTLAPPGEEELRRVNMLRSLGLPPAFQPQIPNAPVPQPMTGGLQLPPPQSLGSAGPLLTGIGQGMPAAAPISPEQQLLSQMSSALQAPLLSSPLHQAGAALSGLWAGMQNTPNPVLAQAMERRNQEIMRIGQLSQLQLQVQQLQLQRQQMEAKEKERLSDISLRMGTAILQHADTPEKQQAGIASVIRAGNLAGVQMDPRIVNAWKSGASTPQKNAMALGDLLAGTPIQVVSERTGVPIDTLAALKQQNDRAASGDMAAIQALKYTTGQDYTDTLKSIQTIREQALRIAREEIESQNIAGDVQRLPESIVPFASKYGPLRELVKDRKRWGAIVTEWVNFQNQQRALQAGLANVPPEATRDLIALGEATQQAQEVWKLVGQNPELIGKYTGLPGLMGLREWLGQRFAGVAPDPEMQKLAQLQFAENRLQALVARYQGGAALGPFEAELYINKIMPNRAAMNTAQYRVAAAYFAKTLPILGERYRELQSVGGKMALSGRPGEFLTDLYKRYPLPDLNETAKRIDELGRFQPPDRFKPIE